MVSDYVELLRKKLGVDLKIVFDIPFDEALARGREGRIDLFPCLSKTPERSEFLLFTKPYFSYPLVIVAREDAPLVGGLEDLRGKRFAVVKHLFAYGKLLNDYPDLNLDFVFTNKVEENLEAVSLGRADACVINLAVAGYYIRRKGLTNLSVAAPVHWEESQYCMGVRKDRPILLGMISRILASVSQEQKDEISRRWIRVPQYLGVDARLIRRWALGIGTGVVFLFVVFFVWNRRLTKEVTARKEAETASETRARHQAAVSHLGQVALDETDLPRLLREAVALTAQTMQVDTVGILELLPTGKELQLVAGVGWSDDLMGKALVSADRGSQAGYTLIAGKPVIVEDLTSETRFNSPKLLSDRGMVSGVSVAVGERNRPFGVLGVHTAYHRDFSEHDVNFLQSVAHVLAAAIERNRTEKERDNLIEELRTALDEVKTLRGLIPICVHCKSIRDDAGYWNKIEEYLLDHSDAQFTHGICPECARKLYPEFYPQNV